MKKTVVAWICHFSNKEIQEIIKPFKKINEIAPWITQLTKLMENEKSINLHIISPHKYISTTKQFNLRGINYYFYNAHMPLWGRHWPNLFHFDYWTNFYFNNIKVEKLIKKINPDLIHLHGAENAYYSSSILKLKNLYPILVTVQGFISHTTQKNWQIDKRIKIEQKILASFSDFGYRTKTMGNQIKVINPHSNLHWHHYPITIPEYRENKKEYDIVYFARISKEKGVEDLIKVCGMLKKQIPQLRVCIIGGATKVYYDYLKEKAKKLGLEKNIYWVGFIPIQQDVHNLASKAKVCVLPSYHEIISGTIIESLFIKLPVVAYNVGSIHEINEKNDIIKLVKRGDILKLAKEIINLLIDNELRAKISETGFKRAHEMFKNEKIITDLKVAYKKIIITFKIEYNK